MLPFAVATIYYLKAPKEPTKLFLVGWATVALAALIPCPVAPAIKEYVVGVAEFVKRAPLYEAILRIFLHNFVIMTLCALLGRAYLGFMLTVTALASRQLAGTYPINVVLGAHTVLEIYAYSLATTRRKLDLVKATAYLMVAATIEAIAIRF